MSAIRCEKESEKLAEKKTNVLYFNKFTKILFKVFHDFFCVCVDFTSSLKLVHSDVRCDERESAKSRNLISELCFSWSYQRRDRKCREFNTLFFCAVNRMALMTRLFIQFCVIFTLLFLMINSMVE